MALHDATRPPLLTVRSILAFILVLSFVLIMAKLYFRGPLIFWMFQWFYVMAYWHLNLVVEVVICFFKVEYTLQVKDTLQS